MCEKCYRNEGVRQAIVAALASKLGRLFAPARPKAVDDLTTMLTIIAPAPLGTSKPKVEALMAVQKAELQRFVDSLSFEDVYALGAAGAAMSSIFEVIESWASGSIARRAEAGDTEASHFVSSLPPSPDEGVMIVAVPGFSAGGDKPLVH